MALAGGIAARAGHAGAAPLVQLATFFARCEAALAPRFRISGATMSDWDG
jgi:hypothetical protein